MHLDYPLTLPGMVSRAAQLFGERPAIVDATHRVSFLEFDALVRRATAAVMSTGIVKGDRIALWAPNSLEWVVVAMGAMAAGAAIVPLNTRYKGREAAFILRRSGARQLFTVGEFLGTRYPELLVGESLPALERVVLLGGTGNSTPRAESWGDYLRRGEKVASESVLATQQSITPDDVADIMFTSGTTGAPKGVMSTHGQNIRVYQTWSETVELREGDRYLIVNPFFHSFGFKAGWLASMLSGATIYPVAMFDAAKMLAQIERDRITVLPGPPTIFQSLLALESRASADLSSLRLAVTGAASVPPILVKRMRAELGFKSVLTAYGLTESTGTVTMCPLGASDEIVATRCGTPIPGVEIRCINERGENVAPNEAGEVLVRGYNVMRGYFDDPAATAEAIDPQGWLHTGDIGVIDDDGYLRIADRKKDMFITGGFNCYPAEIEKILSEHPSVAQVAVVGVADERLGEVGKSYIVPRPDMTPTATEIIAWCRENMANYKVPRYVEFVSALPTNAAGKVQKFQLNEINAR